MSEEKEKGSLNIGGSVGGDAAMGDITKSGSKTSKLKIIVPVLSAAIAAIVTITGYFFGVGQ